MRALYRCELILCTPDHVIDHVCRDGSKIHVENGGDDVQLLSGRDVVQRQGAAEITGELVLHGKVKIAGSGHKTAGDAGGGQIHFIKRL